MDDNTYHGAKLTGIAVGNGCTGNTIGICGRGSQGLYYEWLYLSRTAFFSEDFKERVNGACDWVAAKANKKDVLSPLCIDLLSLAQSKLGTLNIYDVFGDCVNGDSCPLSVGSSNSQVEPTVTKSKIPLLSYEERLGTSDRTHEGYGKGFLQYGRIAPLGGVEGCIDSIAASAYLNQPEVKKAIHVHDVGYCWSVCRAAPGWTYQPTRANLPANTYPYLVSRINVLIFNGDWDACVPYTDNEAWTEAMGYDVQDSWHPWTYSSSAGASNQVAGYAVNYDVSMFGKGTFQFITVKGGRHEVPASAPAQALEMLKRFINHIPF